ncbi:hypothetical protein [Hymenobacter negativus]|uniref:DUF4397 domain-containing protein n=1 Tax=Hymenobacter negativus TaxID=2795026 RepID=A0ABS3QIC2_9BACT|nr:hypothetical protein [Hymenobacter negativus]MBO2010773.1 hypothetical protein [Hymenobacter negativus]
MNTQRYISWLLPVLAVAGGLLASCQKNEERPYAVSSDDQFPTLLTNAFGNATKYAVGETVPIELQFAAQGAPIQEIRIFQRIEPASDSVVVQTLPGTQAVYSRRKFVDTLVVNLVIPPAPNQARVRFSAVVASANGLTKVRSVPIRIAAATPTARIASVSNVTAPAAASLVPGDVVRYSVLLNENGINAYPERPAAPPAATAVLFNNLDSLVTYVRVGTAPERRFARQKLPATGTQTGAATTVNLDLTLPAGTAGQDVVFRFEAKSRYLGTPNFRTASVTAAPITLGTATPLAAVRALSLTYTGTAGGDLAALDLTTFTPVAAAAPATSKDLTISSTASNAVQFRSLSTGTRLVRSTAAAYTNANLNNLRQLYNTAAATAQVTTLDNIVVGDVILLKLRGLDHYAVVQVAGINRTSTTDVVVSLNIKAL